MATLVLTAIGTAIGGPLGGAVGGLLGQQIDGAVFGGAGREGPRLKELAVSTSSYGTALARHHGRMRAPGTIIWSTDLVESTESNGGKGQPSVTSFSYSISFAVAIASRPVQRVGRIWADGNLLRGAAGDLKVGGTMRVYDGYGDNAPDPLIAADMGAETPGFRGLAYVVFENLQLAEFGNRIPALTFEIIADNGDIALTDLLAPIGTGLSGERSLAGLEGYSIEAGAAVQTIAALDALFPVSLRAGAGALQITAADILPDNVAILPEAAASNEDDAFGFASGQRRSRAADMRQVPSALRYYDIDRDYQSGLQRAEGRPRPGSAVTIELPAALTAASARNLANSAAQRAGSSRERLAWRMVELDPQIGPGSVVRVPEQAGLWRVESWEWRDQGIELELIRLPLGPSPQPPADTGAMLPKADLTAGPTILQAFELPWDGKGSGDIVQLAVAPSSASPGWKGAAIYCETGGELSPIGTCGSRRAVIGQTLNPLPASTAQLFDRAASVDIELVPSDLGLHSIDMKGLANGGNRAMVGGEIIQFANADALGNGIWRISGLLRGRGGSEPAAQSGHSAGTAFALLDDRIAALDQADIAPGSETAIVAIGLGDTGPAHAAIANQGFSLRALSPTHARSRITVDGGLELCWSRRARGGWIWQNEVDVPQTEGFERYLVGIGPVTTPIRQWETDEPRLQFSAEEMATLVADNPGELIWVRQIGKHALSDPLQLLQF